MSDDHMRQRFDRYIGELFAATDETLDRIEQGIVDNDMPQISIALHDGHLLQWLMRLVGVKKAVEIGTLGGYSGTWISRALPDDGKLYTLELEPKHAKVARANFEQAGVSDKVEIMLGPAQESLKNLSQHGPFDMVFIDADKESYPIYLAWAITNLRDGGMIAAHNAYRGGGILRQMDEGDRMMAAFNQQLADHPQLDSMIIPIGDGMAVAIKRSRG